MAQVEFSSFRLRLDVGFGGWNSELEFVATNATVWMSVELGDGIADEYRAGIPFPSCTLPQFRGSTLCIELHSFDNVVSLTSFPSSPSRYTLFVLFSSRTSPLNLPTSSSRQSRRPACEVQPAVVHRQMAVEQGP
jgi:hypothetical protein